MYPITLTTTRGTAGLDWGEALGRQDLLTGGGEAKLGGSRTGCVSHRPDRERRGATMALRCVCVPIVLRILRGGDTKGRERLVLREVSDAWSTYEAS